jgi:hypothetical protein
LPWRVLPSRLSERYLIVVHDVVLASWIKLQCGLSNRWFSENLHMGNIYSISKAVAAETKTDSKRSKEWKKLGMPKSKA